MSSSNLKQLAKDMLDDLKKTGAQKKNSDPQARKDLERMTGQVFVLLEDRFKEVIEQTLLAENVPQDKITKDIIEGALGVYIQEVKRQEAEVYNNLVKAYKKLGLTGKSLDDAVEARLIELNKVKSTKAKQGQSFIISSYDNLKRKGNQAVKTYLESKKFKTDKLGGRGLKAGQKFGAQLGHADAVVGGVASSSLRLLSAERLISSSNLSNKDIATIKEVVETLKDSVNLTVTHAQVVDSKGKLLKSYIPVLTYQQAWVNQSLANDAEGMLISSFQKSLDDILNAESSLSLKDSISSVILDNLAGSTSKGKKVSGRHNKVEKSKGKGISSNKFSKTSRVKRAEGAGITVATVKGKRKRSSANSMFSLATIINQKLPDTVRKNMGAPALENVTGRFANSVRITDISATAKGYPSIGYTYMRDPYQVFEVGHGGAAWASTERDPRKLIDASIREIAAEMAIGRFYTRRQ